MESPYSVTRRWLDRLDPLLARLAADLELIAPVEVEGDVWFLPVRDAAAICLDYVNTLVPPKEHLLPTPERLVAYRVEKGAVTVEDEPAPPRERVIFGIRSCDVAGTSYLERWFSGAVFGRADQDEPFHLRREATTLISVVCQHPGPTCMCVCCKGGPALDGGFDWQLTELEDGWLVEIGSPRGARLAERYAAFLKEPPASAAGEKAGRVRAAVARFAEASPHRVPTMAAARMVSTGRLPTDFWRNLGDRCFECGGCAFVCPTCWCFNVADIAEPGEAPFPADGDGPDPWVPGGVSDATWDGRWERVRLRDNCQLAGFVREAGGGYPRSTCGERCLTRFFHKLSQQFQERMGAPGCTGCGRCIVTCLGERGIDRVAEGMRDALTGPGRASGAPLQPAMPAEARAWDPT
ncbi:MAG: 4Fe-4S dicluster domain-containing protein [Bacteroidota bacterium]